MRNSDHPRTHVALLSSFFSFLPLSVLALVVVPLVSVAAQRFGVYLRDFSHKTQAAAAMASSIAEVHTLHHLFMVTQSTE